MTHNEPSALYLFSFIFFLLHCPTSSSHYCFEVEWGEGGVIFGGLKPSVYLWERMAMQQIWCKRRFIEGGERRRTWWSERGRQVDMEASRAMRARQGWGGTERQRKRAHRTNRKRGRQKQRQLRCPWHMPGTPGSMHVLQATRSLRTGQWNCLYTNNCPILSLHKPQLSIKLRPGFLTRDYICFLEDIWQCL